MLGIHIHHWSWHKVKRKLFPYISTVNILVMLIAFIEKIVCALSILLMYNGFYLITKLLYFGKKLTSKYKSELSSVKKIKFLINHK